jgi:carbon starvation protein CstA
VEQSKIDEKMLNAYIGKNADKILKSNINILAVFLGAFYFLYRKAYMIGILFILASLVVPIWWIIERIVYLFAANKIYLWDAQQKILQIINNNPNLSEDEIVEKVKSVGGVNWIFFFLGILAILGMIFLFKILYMLSLIPS